KHPWVLGTSEDADATRNDMKNRTIGRVSMYKSPPPAKKHRSTPPRAGAASSTPSRRSKAVAAPQQQQQQPVLVTPKKTIAEASLAVKNSPVPLATPEQLDEFREKPREEIAQELLGCKKLALQLLDERDRNNEQAK